MTYVNVEALLIAWLNTTLGVRSVTESPPDVSTAVPIIRVVRIGGSDAELTIDRANVDIDCFTLSRGASIDLAERVRYALRSQLPGTQFAGGSFKTVNTISAPSWRPWDDTNVRRVGASYEIRLHTS